MAASSHQQGNDHSNFISNSPHFFKIILQDTIQSGKLGIPIKFVQNHGNGMSSPVLLRVPSGAVWKVELTKCDGKLWLEKGWLEFSNHYSLGFGHLLVFRYDGNSNFHVVILDRGASEIQYPNASNNRRRSNEIPKQIINESEDDHVIQIPGNISPNSKMREKSLSPCPRPHKMMRSTNSAIKTGCSENSGFLAQKVRHNERVKALERARSSFKSENPFFLVVMQPSFVGLGVGKGYCLTIPHNFVEKHLMKGHCSVILRSSSGKSWNVTFNQRQGGKMLYSFLQTGWSTFVRDNNIQLGDVCAFELINSIEISFKVVIYKGQPENCYQSLTSTDAYHPRNANRLNAIEKAKAFEKASAFRSENPFFVIVLQPAYVHGNKLSIPANFARQYLTKMHKEVILLLANGKSWPVIYYQHCLDKPNVIFSKGWPKFAVDNSLKVGDACVFELIKGAETSMNVTIYTKQAVEDANLGSSLDDESKKKQVEVHESLVIKTESVLNE